MHLKKCVAAAVLTSFASGLATSVKAAESTMTVITVQVEMCGGCVKKIKTKLGEFAAIHDVQCDLKTKTVIITPERGQRLSPRELWEAMESIDKTPKRLIGPSGEFASKPKS